MGLSGAHIIRRKDVGCMYWNVETVLRNTRELRLIFFCIS